MPSAATTYDWKFWLLTVLSALTVILAVINIVQSGNARELQAEVNRRQQYLTESFALSRLNSQIIEALATLSAQSNDEAIRSMLAKHGVTFKLNAPARSDAPPPADAS